MPNAVQPVLISRDPDRLIRFYVDVAGAVLTDRQPAEGPLFSQGLRIGDSDLAVVSVADAPAESGRVLLGIEVADVDAALARVEESGGTASGPANDMPWGQRVAHVRDPDGNPLNLTAIRST